MCRLLAYCGKKIDLYSLIYKPDHSIVKQSFQPKEMRTGVVNVDGFGVGWYDHRIEETPAVYKSPIPIRNDLSLPSISRKIITTCAFVHVRGASTGMAIAQVNSHPFTKEKYLFMHNGMTENFRTAFMPKIRSRLSEAHGASIDGTTDSEHVFALFLTLMDRQNGQPAEMETCLIETILQMQKLSKKFKSNVVLNLAVTDGHTTIVTNFSTLDVCASLYAIENAKAYPKSVIVASEPLFEDSAWQPVQRNHYVRAEAGRRLELKRIL